MLCHNDGWAQPGTNKQNNQSIDSNRSKNYCRIIKRYSVLSCASLKKGPVYMSRKKEGLQKWTPLHQSRAENSARARPDCLSDSLELTWLVEPKCSYGERLARLAEPTFCFSCKRFANFLRKRRKKVARPGQLRWASDSSTRCKFTRLGSEGYTGSRAYYIIMAMPCWWAPISAKQLYIAATAGVIWLYASMRKVLAIPQSWYVCISA